MSNRNSAVAVEVMSAALVAVRPSSFLPCFRNDAPISRLARLIPIGTLPCVLGRRCDGDARPLGPVVAALSRNCEFLDARVLVIRVVGDGGRGLPRAIGPGDSCEWRVSSSRSTRRFVMCRPSPTPQKVKWNWRRAPGCPPHWGARHPPFQRPAARRIIHPRLGGVAAIVRPSTRPANCDPEVEPSVGPVRATQVK